MINSEIIKKVYADSILQECYEAGFKAGKFGATEKDNSHFKFFTSPDRTKAWQKGYDLGKKKNKKQGGECEFIEESNGRIICKKHNQPLIYLFSNGKKICQMGEDILISKMGFAKYIKFMGVCNSS